MEDKLALATAKIRWQALKGQALPLLSEPAVMTHVVFPVRSLKLAPGPAGSRYSQEVVAQENGVFDIEEQYEIRVSPDQAGGGVVLLPAPYGLINRVSLTVVNLDVDVLSPQAVSIKCDHAGTNTVASLVLSPAEAMISWRPRSRDPRREKPVFYAEMAQLFVPSGGVVEGAHYVSIRPAQGELAELTFNVPTGATVTDVMDPAQQPNGAAAPALPWRFDPDTRKLRVTLESAAVAALRAADPVAGRHRPAALRAIAGIGHGGQRGGSNRRRGRHRHHRGSATGRRHRQRLVSHQPGGFPSERVLRLSRPNSGADPAPRLPLLRRRGQPVLESLGGGTGCAGRNQGHLVAGRGPHHAGGQFHGGHHARGHFQLEFCHAGRVSTWIPSAARP